MTRHFFIVPVVVSLLCLLPTYAAPRDSLSITGSDNPTTRSAPTLSQDVYYKTKGPISGAPAPRTDPSNYPNVVGESRVAIWVVAQQHLYWGGFVLGGLFIITLLEIGVLLGARWNRTEGLDDLAYDLLSLILLGLSVTAILGGMFILGLLTLYPDLTAYLMGIFRPAVLLYGLLALGLTFATYLYFYSWKHMRSGGAKWIHASLGVLVNTIGTTIVLTANAWSSFMLSPAGVDERGQFLGNVWHAIHTATWNVTNIHRIASHIILAAAVLGAYSAYRAWTAKEPEERVRFDWMSYRTFLFLVFTLFTMQFGGYWLIREIYAYRQQMGITQLGGLLAWLNVVRVSMMAVIFLGINYYLWQRINATEHGRRYGRYAKYVFLILTLCSAVYITPHTFVMTPLELKQMGGQQHPVVGNYGIESAKSTAANLMIVVTAWTLGIWQYCRFSPSVMANWRPQKYLIPIFLVGAANILRLGSYGYYIPANVRIGLSMPMIATSVSLLIIGLALTTPRNRGEKHAGLRWGTLAPRGYFALFGLAFIVTWIIGLGGYLRSSVRLFWHVNEIMRDTSPWAFTHTSGFAANVISLNALLFWAGLLFILWLSQMASRKEMSSRRGAPDPAIGIGPSATDRRPVQ